MRILVLNSGSSSLKFELIETTPELIAAEQERVLAHGSVSRIGAQDAVASFEAAGAKTRSAQPIPTHEAALKAAFDFLRHSGSGIEAIDGVGHRVVHGGEYFRESVVIDEEVVRRIEETSALAPLHNPHNLKGYFASKALLPNAIQVAVFDTAFHQTLPARAFLYGIPYDYYTRDKIRRYGFHGTSHRYISGRFAQLRSKTTGKPAEEFRLITCHLGNGSSVCAIDRGRSVDTSMGLTPLEGLLMGTRSGDIDAGAVMYLAKHRATGQPEPEVLLNECSGLLGLSGVSNDMQDVLKAAEQGNQRAHDAVEVFCYRVTKYIGAYFAALGGADAVIFAGGIGENAASIRARICEPLAVLGLILDPGRNANTATPEREIGASGAKVEAWVIPTNEELLIARDTMHAILGMPRP